MKTPCAYLFAAAVLSLVPAPVRSQPQEAASLEKQEVEGFLDAMADLQAWAQDNEREFEGEERTNEADFSSAYSAMIAGFQAAEFAEEIDGIVSSHGFEDVLDWANTGSRVIQAYSALKYDETASDRKSAQRDALKQIEESGMDEAQKEAMRKLLGGADEVMQAFADVSEADKQAVAPFVERIESMGEEPRSDD